MKTKIIATIGPSTMKHLNEIFSIAKVARFNFSHSDYQFFKKAINKLKKINPDIALLADLKGPEIRIKKVRKKEIKKGEEIIIGKDIILTYKHLAYYVDKEDIIKIDDGRVELKVKKVEDDKIIVEAITEGQLQEKKAVNVPGKDIEMPALTNKDYEDLKFIQKHDFDFIAQSFVKRREDIIMLKEVVGEEKAIIAKIEHQKAIKNLKGILKESIGVMVARGDLGVETDIAYLPIIQREIINKARQYGKAVIVATHLLRSMVEDPMPSRAEISDIYFAVSAKPDALMLSEETAIGKYPVEAVNYMKHIIEVAEEHYFGKDKGIVKIKDIEFEELVKIVSSMEIPRIIKWKVKDQNKRRLGKLLRGVI